MAILKSIDALPVQRNSGIDGFLRKHFNEKPVPVKIQGKRETLNDAIEKLDAGASLVQVYTGFIYEGPELVKRINKAILER